jgi:hypothetical protein
MKNTFVLLAVFFLADTFAFSNDGRAVWGSSVEMIDNENTNVIMQEEEIIITLHKNYYEVDVTFNFYNEGDDETILVGFPVQTLTYDIPEERFWARIENFKSYINGEPVTDHSIKYEEKKEFYLNTTTWHIKEVTFPANTHTLSRVTYMAPYNLGGSQRSAGYIYGTGRNWKGPIGKMAVVIKHGDDLIINDITFGIKRPFDKLIFEASGVHRFIFENIEPDDYERIEVMVRQDSLFDEYNGQFDHFWVGWVWNKDLLYRDNMEKKLLTRNQIKLFINFFYAMHGYNFENPLLKAYFERITPQWRDNDYWKYEVNPKFSEDSFNGYERKNIDYLRNMEENIQSKENLSDFDDFLRILLSVEIPERANETVPNEETHEQSEEANPAAGKNNNLLVIIFLCMISFIVTIIIHEKNFFAQRK